MSSDAPADRRGVLAAVVLGGGLGAFVDGIVPTSALLLAAGLVLTRRGEPARARRTSRAVCR